MSATGESRLWVAAALVVWLALGLFGVFGEAYASTTVRHAMLAALVVTPLFLFGEAILEALFEVVAYWIGRVAVVLVSFGNVRAERLTEAFSFPWHGLVRAKRGYVLSAEATSLFGLVIVFIAAAMAFVVFAT